MGGEILLIFVAILVLFGADKLPEFAKGLGKGLREVKKATDEIKNELTNSSSELMGEVNSIKNNLLNDSKEITSSITETKDEIQREISTEIPDVYKEAQKNIEVEPYYEQVKKNSEPKNENK